MHRIILMAMMPVFMSGCGLIDSSITRFDLRMPERTFTIDTAQWDLMTSGAVFPDIPCDSDPSVPDVCETAVADICQGDQCTGQCVTGSCEMTVQVSLLRPVDLYSANPELQTINDQPLIDVRVESVFYTVPENTLNFETPAFTLYMAPQNVMEASDPAAREVGQIPAIAPGTQAGKTNVLIDASHEAVLEEFMGNYRTPFNFIVATEITVQPGDPVPMGAITANVGVDASAGF